MCQHVTQTTVGILKWFSHCGFMIVNIYEYKGDKNIYLGFLAVDADVGGCLLSMSSTNRKIS